MPKIFPRPAALAAFLFTLAAACAPVSEPIIRPLPEGAALDTAGRPYIGPIEVPPEFSSAVQRGTRTRTGAPGQRYWQQRVRYSIQAEVDPKAPSVKGSERIVYHNNSPDSLTFVVMNLYQNLFRMGSGPMNTGGLNLTRLVAQGTTLGQLSAPDFEANRREGRHVPGYIVQGTLARLILPRAIQPGDSAVFEAEWNFRVPPTGAPRTGYEDALNGRVLQIAQWYPQIATYDDVVGADITPYTGQGEFYLEYGDFDYSVTLPQGWIVGGTGVLQNPEEVLAPAVLARYRAAQNSDSMTSVVTRAELGQATTAGTNGRVTWRFTARDVRDVAFATSNRYLWDATRAAIPNDNGQGTRNVAVHTLYRPGAPHWERSIRHADHSTEFLSRVIIPYLYPQITVSEGPIYGMEYPMIVFIGRPDEERGLYEVIAHEIAHEWFPMMVGQDEAAFAWMDEGFTTFHEALAVNDFFRGGPDQFTQPRQVYLSVAGNRLEAALMRSADEMTDAQMGIAAYYKPGTLLRSLRAVVGDSVFHRAMRTYAREWLLKHPYPWDWFNTIEREAGRDLDWFWNPFWYRTVTFDQAIASVTPGSGSVQVTVRDVGQAPGPTFITVTTAGGGTVRETIPAERWLSPSTRVQTVTIPVSGQVTRVELDPEQIFPDVNRRNNAWTP